MIENIKWGPDKVFLVPIQHDQAGKIIDLTEEVGKLVRPSYKKSGAKPFNGSIDFIFEGGEDRWDFDARGKVDIRTTCTTDPKRLDGRSWTMQFQGTWDVAKAQFLRKKSTRVPPPTAKERSGD